MNKFSKSIKRMTVFALVFAFASVTLAGCGKKVSEGYWELTEISEGKKTVKSDSLEEYGLEETYIVTEENGDGYMVLFGMPADFKTDSDKGSMMFETGKVDYKLSGKKLTLADSNVSMVFTKSKNDAPKKPETVALVDPSSKKASKDAELFEDIEDKEQSNETSAKSEENGDSEENDKADDNAGDGPYNLNYSSPREYFEGNWYGWWKLDGRTDFWKSLNGEVFDVLCKVEMKDDVFGVMTLWDSGMPYDKPIARMNVLVTDKGVNPKIGYMQSDAGGTFLDGEVTNTTWSTDPGAFEWKNYMMITGTYVDGDGKDAFDYVFHLKKWGDDWSDFSQKPPMFDWYKKQIDAGAPMPDTLPGD